MFSGEMMLNPQIFGRAQATKRAKSKRSGHRHSRSRSSKSVHSKIPISSPNGPSRQHIPNQKAPPSIPAIVEREEPMADSNGMDVNQPESARKPFKIKMNFEDNQELFGHDNGDKLPFPGMETKAQLIEMLLRDEYYSNVICDGQLPAKQIFIGLLYLLLIIAVDAFVEMTFVSMIVAAIIIAVLYVGSSSFND